MLRSFAVVLVCFFVIAVSGEKRLMRELLTLDCAGRLHIMDSTQMATTIHLGQTIRAMDSLLSRVHDRVDCMCGSESLPESEFRHRYSPIEAMVFTGLYGEGYDPPQRSCLDDPGNVMRDFVKFVRTFTSQRVESPESCSPKNYYGSNGTCALRFNVVDGLNIGFAMTQCPTNTYFPYVSITCEGPLCDTAQPCSLNEDCPQGTMSCQNAFEYFGMSQQSVVNGLTDMFMYPPNTQYATLKCPTPESIWSKMFLNLKDIFPKFPANFEEVKLCFPTQPLDALIPNNQYIYQNKSMWGKIVTIQSPDPKAKIYPVSSWDGTLENGQSVFNLTRLNGDAFKRSNDDPPKEGTQRLFKLGCDSVISSVSGPIMQFHHLNDVLSSFGDAIMSVWMCRAKNPSVNDVEQLSDPEKWSDSFEWLQSYFIPMLRLHQIPWDGMMWIWGMTTNGTGLSLLPIRKTPSFLRGFFDPTFVWPQNGTIPPPLPTSEPEVIATPTQWRLHPQTPPPRYSGNVTAIIIEDDMLKFENVSLTPEGSDCAHAVCTSKVEVLGSLRVARLACPQSYYQFRFEVCVDANKLAGTLVFLDSPNTGLVNHEGDRFKTPNTCSVDQFLSDGVCGMSFTDIIPHASIHTYISTCSTLSFGHSSIDVSCVGTGCAALQFQHVCTADSDCLSGMTCMEFGSIMLDAFGAGMSSVPGMGGESSQMASMLPTILADHDVLGGLLFGGIKNINNLTDIDISGLIQTIMMSNHKCMGRDKHLKDVIAMYNGISGANFPLTSTTAPKVCYSQEYALLWQKVSQYRSSGLTTMTPEEAQCTGGHCPAVTWSLPGTKPHSPWRKHVVVRISFKQRNPSDLEGVINKLAKTLNLARENIAYDETGPNYIDIQFEGLSNAKELATSVLQKPPSWWAQHVTDAVVSTSCDGECPKGFPTHGGNNHPHTQRSHRTPAGTIVLIVFGILALVVGIAFLVKNKVMLSSSTSWWGKGGWLRLPTNWSPEETTDPTSHLEDAEFDNSAAELNDN